MFVAAHARAILRSDLKILVSEAKNGASWESPRTCMQDELAFRRVFGVGDALKGTLQVIDPITNLYILATYLSSDYLWERTSVIAQNAAAQAELVLDVNSSSTATTTAITTSRQGWRHLCPQRSTRNDWNLSKYQIVGANLSSVALVVNVFLTSCMHGALTVEHYRRRSRTATATVIPVSFSEKLDYFPQFAPWGLGVVSPHGCSRWAIPSLYLWHR
jgi:hypothetical protein